MTPVDEFLQSAKEMGADDTVIQNILNQLIDDYDQRLSIQKAAQNSTNDPNLKEHLKELEVIPFLLCDGDGIKAGFVKESVLKDLQNDNDDSIVTAFELLKYYRH